MLYDVRIHICVWFGFIYLSILLRQFSHFTFVPSVIFSFFFVIYLFLITFFTMHCTFSCSKHYVGG